MTELSGFERRLTAGLEAQVGPPRPVDALAIVRSAAAREPVRPSVRSRLLATIGLGGRVGGRRFEDLGGGRKVRPLVIVMVLGLVAAVAFGALAVGSGLVRLSPVVPPPAPTVRPATSTPDSAATPGAASWTATGEMTTGRYLQTATVLPDGSVLTVGGRNDDASGAGRSLASAETYDATTGSWTAIADMANRRSAHTATLLPDGRVLVAGGYDDWNALDSAEIYDPANGSWTATGTMTEGRGYHTATLLPDGRVLVAGGRSNDSSTGHALASAELYDPVTGSWSATGPMLAAHTFDAATLLSDGRVLLTGAGYRGYGLSSQTSAELYDPSSGSWTATKPMVTAGAYQTANLLENGKVLVAGGFAVDQVGCCSVTNGAPAAVQLYDPTTGSWTEIGAMTDPRTYHTSTLLPDGQVLVTGGHRAAGGGTSTFSTDRGLGSAELFDPTSGEWTAAGDLAGRRGLHVAVLLSNGQVLAAGGSSAGHALRTAELFGTR